MATKQVRVVKLAHVVYQHPDLEKALSFLFDFGFIEESRTANRVYLRGYGAQPYIYVAEQSPDNKRHFMGAYWVVNSAEDLKTAAAHSSASPVEESDAPGGGKIVTLKDPNGFNVGFVYGQKLRDSEGPAAPLEKTPTTPNTSLEKPRKGVFRRFKTGASPVHKLGHYGFIVPASKFETTLGFYRSLINLKPTDAVFNPATGKDETCFCHIDLGAQFTDHHVRSNSPLARRSLMDIQSFFVAGGPEDSPVFIHHSSYEVNDFDTQTLGHDWLRSKGWTNCWGIGRHVLGSQIFDYWFDGSGNIVEHYSDGDLVSQPV